MERNKRQIIIIESSPTDTLTKLAKTLRKKDYETVFITLIGNIEIDFLKESYDKIISFDAKFFKINFSSFPKILSYGIKKFPSILKSLYEIQRLKPYMIIGRATPNWLCALFRIYFQNYPFIYFPYDIRSLSYKNVEHAISLGIPNFEIASEKYCFKNSDGIIHKGSEGELNSLNKNVLGDIKIKCPHIYFFPYTLKDFFVPFDKTKKLSYKNNNIHLVYVGHVPDDKDWVEGIERIIKQKICLHLYSKTNNITKEEEKKRVTNILKRYLKNRFLFLHEAVSQEKLSREISKYDYGLYSYCTVLKKGYENATGNKIASYLEAGLPILAPSFYSSASKLIEKQGIGIVLNSQQFNELRKIIRKNQPEIFQKNIIKVREEFSMENQIIRLENLFKEAVKNKEKRLNQTKVL